MMGKCSFMGVDVHTGDGTAITDFFDDNVQMKEFHWYINGMSNVWVNPEAHPFRVGETTITVEGRDLAGNTRSCHRTVKVLDTQPPKWAVDPTSVDAEITVDVDESCTRTATSVFAEYESLGWAVAGTDNCGVEGVARKLQKDGVVVYDDSKIVGDDVLRGPGSYELVYTLTDVHGLQAHHTVAVHLQDSMPPTAIADCPADIFMEVEDHETSGAATWTVPHVVEDNCLAYGTLPVAQSVSGVGSVDPTGANATGTLPVGNTRIAYPVYDAFGNLYADECTFEVIVKQKGAPVSITCPDDVVVDTFELAPFGAPDWDPPQATQGNETLGASHISYLHGAGPRLPFLYGVTEVTARAQGRVTGERTREEEQRAECSFRVTVRDPYRPNVDGRHFRCQAEGGVEPYGVCDGTDLRVTLHSGYEETGGYDLESAVTLTNQTCCNDQTGAAYSCQPGASPLFQYCQPA